MLKYMQAGESSVGFQVFELRPNFVTGLEFVDVSYTTGYGEIKSSWRRDADTIEWKIQIPDNSSAWVTLPDKPGKLFNAGNYSFVINN